MSDELSAEVQQQIQELQGLAQQMQGLARQRSQMELLEAESKRAKEALEAAADDAKVYRNLGALLIEDDRAAAIERLGDELDTLEIRVKRAKEQEKMAQDRLDTLQAQIEKALQ